MSIKRMLKWLMPELEKAMCEMWGDTPHALHFIDMKDDEGRCYSIGIMIVKGSRVEDVVKALRPILSDN